MKEDFFAALALIAVIGVFFLVFLLGAKEGNKTASEAIKACEAELPRNRNCKIIAVEDKQ